MRKDATDHIIVSLTSFPERIGKVWIVIESILRQTELPDRIILWLYNGEFADKDSLPPKLLRLEKRGLEIKFCDQNLFPHKKYFYAMKDNPDSIIITIDDDMIYPMDLISNLKKNHQKYPNSIICCITRTIKQCNDQIKPYKDWDYVSKNTRPLFQNLIMSGGGTLFPPDSIHRDAFNLDCIMKYCIKTDDIWLKIMSLRKKTKVASIAGEYKYFFMPLRYKKKYSLMHENIHEGQNDKTMLNLMSKYGMNVNQLKD